MFIRKYSNAGKSEHLQWVSEHLSPERPVDEAFECLDKKFSIAWFHPRPLVVCDER